MTIPKFILAGDFINSPDQIYVVHTAYPQFVAANSKNGMKPEIVADFVKDASAKAKEEALLDAQVYLFDKNLLGPAYAPIEHLPSIILSHTQEADIPFFVIVTEAPYGIFGIEAVESPFPRPDHFIVSLAYEDYFGATKESQKNACLNKAINYYSMCERSYFATEEITELLKSLGHNKA
ncbi:hypothetical protein [Filimonas effusa]|uniref:Uncharacterized protein n=1 Tax=Filimonas effusa TaxID=2508721 RepID=A0A4Q1DC43_9BACT|nr:hypothetical protein [Filimonas effusa]RXK86910.1 hypothetical protein ESB13_09005 [Filimonas effusa]